MENCPRLETLVSPSILGFIKRTFWIKVDRKRSISIAPWSDFILTSHNSNIFREKLTYFLHKMSFDRTPLNLTGATTWVPISNHPWMGMPIGTRNPWGAETKYPHGRIRVNPCKHEVLRIFIFGIISSLIVNIFSNCHLSNNQQEDKKVEK